ncbi:rho GDP-dissociation inhibitor 1-like [Ptychodera flava]|uniref:rho GDP-dissociation inhibitor 1-like n=1 Tax=Ptychodera flava TaxID=63121 RepID=UPI003969ED85
MAEEEANTPPSVEDDDDNESTGTAAGYKPPAKKTLEEIQKLDDDDESLVKYKQALLAGMEAGTGDPSDPRRVIVEKMSLVTEGREDVHVDLTGDLTKLKSKPFVIKEGAEYKIRVTFKVQHEIVSGLRYHQTTYRKGIRVDKTTYMVGSYGPKAESHQYITPIDEAPKGMVSRGHYTVKSKFIDDDKHEHLSWEWSFDIKKDWE